MMGLRKNRVVHARLARPGNANCQPETGDVERFIITAFVISCHRKCGGVFCFKITGAGGSWSSDIDLSCTVTNGSRKASYLGLSVPHPRPIFVWFFHIFLFWEFLLD